MTSSDPNHAKRRWRLALGRYSERQLGGLSGQEARADRALDYLYGREYDRRGLHRPSGPGSLDPTQMKALDWLGEARKLFPQSVFEVMQDHALDRYGLTDLLSDPKTLDSLEPNQELLKTLLSFHGRASPDMKEKLRQVADAVIQDVMRRLHTDVQRAFSGRRNPFKRSHMASAANFDWRGTLRRNLKNYDPETGRIIADDLRFVSRERRRLPWSVILCVDQSGSMTDSIIHSAVMAAILSGLPGVKVSMVLFDTSIIDVTDKLTDPLETLLSVQLGGGTNIGRAVEYCERFVDTPERTVFVLISDFAEGASPRRLYQSVARMNEAKVRLIGLSALDDLGDPYLDKQIAGRLAGLGMHVGAMTPDRLAIWLAEVMR
ncbi:VWA domain-containing protein [Tropicibacter sp. R15_0]|uniref:VWA domain-containing protein n=1 Tax=Tropicibacter sp. R15_0 TaxID=2821101 RepID=UPI001ADD4387|nr:VWA domain-containing protein [Tropicibacter sp. R15_0]MBO9465446.1 VWA domain-containing protein [Tropicibacter sp. R15_0]